MTLQATACRVFHGRCYARQMPLPDDSSALVSALIFDLDGVLVDSEIWWDDVRRAWAAGHGRTWTAADRAAVMGANSAAWARTMR